jgi:hypothetical protein
MSELFLAAILFTAAVNKALGGNNRFRAMLLEYLPSMDLVLRRRPVPARVAFERIKRSLLSDDSESEAELRRLLATAESPDI